MDASFAFGLTILSLIVPYNYALAAVTPNSTTSSSTSTTTLPTSSSTLEIREQTSSSTPEIREQTSEQASSSTPTLEENDSYEGTSGQQQNNQSPEKFFAQIDDNIRDKFEGLDNRMSNVNNNMEMLKKKFDMLSANENYVNQKLFNFEAGMNDKLEKIDRGIKQKIDNLERKLDSMKSDADNNNNNNSGNEMASSDESSMATDDSLSAGTKNESETSLTWFGRVESTVKRRAKCFWKFLYEW